MYHYLIEEEKRRILHVKLSWLITLALLTIQIIAYFLIPNQIVLTITYFIIGFSTLMLICVLNYVTRSYLDAWFDTSAVGLISLCLTLSGVYFYTGQPTPPTNAHLLAFLAVALSFMPLIGTITFPLSVLVYRRHTRKKSLSKTWAGGSDHASSKS